MWVKFGKYSKKSVSETCIGRGGEAVKLGADLG